MLFISKNKLSVKILFADPTCLWAANKQFAKGALATEFKILQRPQAQVLLFSELAMLLVALKNSFGIFQNKFGTSSKSVLTRMYAIYTSGNLLSLIIFLMEGHMNKPKSSPPARLTPKEIKVKPKNRLH